MISPYRIGLSPKGFYGSCELTSMRRRYLLSSVLIILLVVGIVEWYGESNSIFL